MEDIKLPENYSGEDRTFNYTEPLRKLWGSKLPQSLPYVENCETSYAIFNEHKVEMGPFYRWQDKLFIKVVITLNPKPLIEAGYQGEEQISESLFIKAYGNDFDYKIKGRMLQLVRYIGLNVSQFDLEGGLSYKWNI